MRAVVLVRYSVVQDVFVSSFTTASALAFKGRSGDFEGGVDVETDGIVSIGEGLLGGCVF